MTALIHIPLYRADERTAEFAHALCGAKLRADFVSDDREDVTCPKCLALGPFATGAADYRPLAADPPHYVDTEYCGDTMPVRLSFQIRVF